MSKTALITGITGQDGALLARYLLQQNYKILAPTRKNPDKSKLSHFKIDQDAGISFIEYREFSDFDAIISEYYIDEIYHLAAMSHVGESHKYPDKVFNVNTLWTLEILKAIESHRPETKLFFASSCEIYKNDIETDVVETDGKEPNNPYGISKLAAHQLVKYYRQVKNIYACNGILFNHESEIRDEAFVSKKICREVARIVSTGGEPLYLGNIEAKKDWGYAADYVRVFQAILQQESADDYNVCTGVLHSVKDMVDSAFNALNYEISWQGKDLGYQALNNQGQVVVAIDERFFRPLDNRFLCGDNSKIKKKIRDYNLTPFESWVKSMTLTEYRKST